MRYSKPVLVFIPAVSLVLAAAVIADVAEIEIKSQLFLYMVALTASLESHRNTT